MHYDSFFSSFFVLSTNSKNLEENKEEETHFLNFILYLFINFCKDFTLLEA